MPRHNAERRPVLGSRVYWDCHGAAGPGLFGAVVALVGDYAMTVEWDGERGHARHLPQDLFDSRRWWFEDEYLAGQRLAA
jgi:hypothetical protein